MKPPFRSALAFLALLALAPPAGAGTLSALEPPPSFLFQAATGRVSQMAQKPGGPIYAPSMEQHAILILSEQGSLLGSFGSYGAAPGRFNSPSGIAIDSDGNFYVCDQFNHRVQKFSPTFLPLLSMGTGFGPNPGQLTYPTNCAFSPDESKLYVTELINNRISIFNRNGTFLGIIGSSGSAPGQFNYPYGIDVDPTTGDIFVANELNHRIDRLKGDGTYLSSIGQFGSGIDDFNLVVGLDLDADGNLWATDQLNNRIKKIAQDGTTLAVWGSFGPDPNQFYNPWAVFVTQDKNIWVGDTYNYRLQAFGYLPVPADQTTWGAVKARYR